MIVKFVITQTPRGVIVDEESNGIYKSHRTNLVYTPKRNKPFIRITTSTSIRKQITIRLDKLVDNKYEVNL